MKTKLLHTEVRAHGAYERYRAVTPRKLRCKTTQENEDPVLSILCFTYNHVKFIKHTIEGFLEQQTRFPVEILIHDDASSDGTTDLILEYQKRFPELIYTRIQAANQFSRGVNVAQFLCERIRGEFYAVCEGDDYWINSSKLEKQVKFLTENPKYAFVFHNSLVLNESNGDMTLSSNLGRPATYSQRDLIGGNFIMTATKVSRTRLLRKDITIPTDLPGDWIGHFTEAEDADFYYFPEPMSVYRVHDKGIWSPKPLRTRVELSLKTLDFVQTLTDKDYSSEIRKAKTKLVEGLFSSDRWPLSQVMARLSHLSITHDMSVVIWGYGELGKQLITNSPEIYANEFFRIVDKKDMSQDPIAADRYISPKDFLKNFMPYQCILLITTMYVNEVISDLLASGWDSFNGVYVVSPDTNE